MRRFRLQVFFGLFFSAFIRMGFCFLFFLIGILLSGVNKMFLYFGLGCLVFQVLYALLDAIYCMRAIKRGDTGNPDLDEFFQVVSRNDHEDPVVDIAKALTKLTGGVFQGPDSEDNIYLPLAEQMKSRIHEDTTTAEAIGVFREIVESSGFEDETISFSSLVTRRDADWKKYFVMVFHLESKGYQLHFTLYYKHTFSDPNTILEIICDEGRESFYQEVYDHKRYKEKASVVPLRIDVICCAS